MEKYMGNKTKFCQSIYNEINKIYPFTPNQSFFDPFTGTTNVSRFFKEKGYNIVCNDINDFSYVLGKAYIQNSKFPVFEGLNKNTLFIDKYNKLIMEQDFINNREKLLKENSNTSNIEKLQEKEAEKYVNVLTYLTYYCDESDYDDGYNLFFDYYCEHGKYSNYINQVYLKTIMSVRKKYINNSLICELIDQFLVYPFHTGYIVMLSDELFKLGDWVNHDKLEKFLSKGNLIGKRKFFSEEHGKRLDCIYNTVCSWKNNRYITSEEYYVLITAIIETVTIFSNTSATYQAFYKEYRMNTQQDFRIVIPDIDTTTIKSEVLQADAFKIIESVSADIIYLDPPYNWRQYDSNYHLLNTIAKFNDLDDKEMFLSQIVGASGENRIQKLSYTSFNRKSTFEDLLLSQIKKSKCKCVALSYSDSESNHKREEIDETLTAITNFFENKNIFESFNMIKLKSRNFESRKGNSREDINELLFIAKKK